MALGRLLRDASLWAPYFACFPSNPELDLAIFWGVEFSKARDGRRAKRRRVGADYEHTQSLSERPDNLSETEHTTRMDARKALEMSQGTELDRHLRSANSRALISVSVTARDVTGQIYQVHPQDEVALYFTTVSSLLPDEANLGGFARAYALVSTRAFVVDAWHGLAMVPVADA